MRSNANAIVIRGLGGNLGPFDGNDMAIFEMEQFYKGLSGFEGRCFLRNRNRVKCILTYVFKGFLKMHKVQRGTLANLMIFYHFGAFCQVVVEIINKQYVL